MGSLDPALGTRRTISTEEAILEWKRKGSVKLRLAKAGVSIEFIPSGKNSL